MANYVEDLVQNIYTKCDVSGLEKLNKKTDEAVWRTAALEKNLLAIKALQTSGYGEIAKNLNASVSAMAALNQGIKKANAENIRGIDLSKQAYLGKKYETQLLALQGRERLRLNYLEEKYNRQRAKWQKADLANMEKRSWLQRNFGKLIAGAFLFQQAKEFINTGSRIQLVQKSIEGLTKSTQDWQYIQQQAFRTGTDIEVVAKGYRNFYSSAKMAGFDKGSIQGMYGDVLLSTRAIGATTQQTEGALLALEQMISKGTVSMEELRRQLGNALPGAFEIAAKSMNMTTAEFNKLVRTGKLSSEVFVPRFIKTLKETYASGFKDIEQTVSVASIRLSNSWKLIQAEFISGEGGKAFAQGLNQLRELLDSPEFKQFMVYLGQAFSLIVKILSFAIKHIKIIGLIMGSTGLLKILMSNRRLWQLLNVDILNSTKAVKGLAIMTIGGFKAMTRSVVPFIRMLYRVLAPLLLIEDGIYFMLEQMGYDVHSQIGANIALHRRKQKNKNITLDTLPKEIRESSVYQQAVQQGDWNKVTEILKNYYNPNNPVLKQGSIGLGGLQLSKDEKNEWSFNFGDIKIYGADMSNPQMYEQATQRGLMNALMSQNYMNNVAEQANSQGVVRIINNNSSLNNKGLK